MRLVEGVARVQALGVRASGEGLQGYARVIFSIVWGLL